MSDLLVQEPGPLVFDDRIYVFTPQAAIVDAWAKEGKSGDR